MSYVFLGNIKTCKNIDFDSFPSDVEIVLTDNIDLAGAFGIVIDDDFYIKDNMTFWEYLLHDFEHSYEVNGKFI